MLHRPLDVVVDDIDILPADDIAERVFYTVALKQLLDNGVVHAPAADLHKLIGIAGGRSLKRAVKRVVDRPRRDEIEMLIILKEGRYAEYKKSCKKPSDFCKTELKLPKVKNYNFVKQYFGHVDTLINAICEYKRVSNIPKGECTLMDILKPETIID